MPTGIFDRPDVRLVLDVGGGTGAFAEAVWRTYGDRIVAMTGHLWAAENDRKYGHQFPLSATLSARGHVGVMVDMFSFFPFGESSLDVVFTSWTFHTGFPRSTLLEVHRVLRPGGYFLIRQLPGTDANLQFVRELGAGLGWELIYDENRCPLGHNRDNSRVLAFRMPLPPTWLARDFDEHMRQRMALSRL